MPCVVFVCREAGVYEVAGVFESYLTELTWLDRPPLRPVSWDIPPERNLTPAAGPGTPTRVATLAHRNHRSTSPF